MTYMIIDGFRHSGKTELVGSTRLVYNYKNMEFRQIIDSEGTSDYSVMSDRVEFLKNMNQRRGYAKALYVVKLKEWKNV